MRSRAACAATAKAIALVLRPDVDPRRAALLLAESTTTRALQEAIGHLGLSLFDDDDRIAADAAQLLALALARRSPSLAA
jgi:hypothetical protein